MADSTNSLRKRTRRSLNLTLNETVSPINEVINCENITLSGLLRVQWKAFHTSLILEKSRAELNQAKGLAITKTISMCFENERQIAVHLTRCPGIQLTDDSPEAFFVEVLFSKQTVYMGYFLNWSITTEANDQLEHLPLLLVKGKTKIAQIVNKALQKTFDFVITPIFLTTPQLVSVFAIFVNYSDKEDNKSAALKYSVPGAPRSSFITTSIRVRDLCVTFDFCNETVRDDDEPIPLTYYRKILNHFQRSFQLDLARAELQTISFPDANITNSGKFQGKNEDVLSATLAVLNTLFENNAPQPPPSSFASDSES